MTSRFSSDLTSLQTKSKKELQFSYWIYLLISTRWINSLGESIVLFFQKYHLPFPYFLLKKSIFKQFCGGETLEECQLSIQQLAEVNIHTFLDYSVEANNSKKSQRKVFNKLCHAIEFASNHSSIPCVVFKASALTRLSKAKPSFILIEKLCQLASQKNVQLMVDAEESWVQGTIDEIALEMMLQFNHEKIVVYNTYQCYRKDALDRLMQDFEICKKSNVLFGVKLVRGAYLEKESRRAKRRSYENPLNPTKEATDDLFNRALTFCVENIKYITLCCASHNEYSNELLIQLLEKHHILPSDQRIYFTQLYGMGDHISYHLAQHGFCVSKYLPYGKVKEVIPYLIRRSRENQSVKGEMGRELSIVKKALKLYF